MGDLLFAVVAFCRARGIDAEAALRAVSRRFRDQLAEVERDVRATGAEPSALGPVEWRDRWAPEG